MCCSRRERYSDRLCQETVSTQTDSLRDFFWNYFRPCLSHPRKCESDSFGAVESPDCLNQARKRQPWQLFPPVRNSKTNKLWNTL